MPRKVLNEFKTENRIIKMEIKIFNPNNIQIF